MKQTKIFFAGASFRAQTYRHAQEARLCVDVRVDRDPLLDMLGVERGYRWMVRYLKDNAVPLDPQLEFNSIRALTLF